MKTYAVLLWLLAFSSGKVIGQKWFSLENPSFEADKPAWGALPSGWLNRGSDDQTPPDLQPGFFQVEMPAQDGQTYLGLVVRENNTWEGVGQELKHPLKKDSAYTFSLWLSRSNVYRSATPTSTEIVNFSGPTILKIWGYNTKTGQEELLAESTAVGHSKWVRYEFILQPKTTDCDELDLMAYYAPGQESKNGNLLIDNCSVIQRVEMK